MVGWCCVGVPCLVTTNDECEVYGVYTVGS